LTDLTEAHKDSDGKIGSLETLKRLSQWLNTSEALSILPRNDHVMLFTGWVGALTTLAVAISNSVCSAWTNGRLD